MTYSSLSVTLWLAMWYLGREHACGHTSAVGGAHRSEADILGLRLEITCSQELWPFRYNGGGGGGGGGAK